MIAIPINIIFRKGGVKGEDFLLKEWFPTLYDLYYEEISLSEFLSIVSQEFYKKVPKWNVEYGAFLMIADGFNNVDMLDTNPETGEMFLEEIENLDWRCKRLFYVSDVFAGGEEFVDAIPMKKEEVLGFIGLETEEVTCGIHPTHEYINYLGWRKKPEEYPSEPVRLIFTSRATIHSHAHGKKWEEYLSMPDLLHVISVQHVSAPYAIFLITKNKVGMYFEAEAHDITDEQFEELMRFLEEQEKAYEAGKITEKWIMQKYDEFTGKLLEWGYKAQLIKYTF